MEIELAVTAFVALFVIIDPIGLSPLFVALTQDNTKAERRAIAIRACLVGLGILAIFGLVGEKVLSTIGIGMPAFRISGGLLLFLTALEMLFGKRAQRRENQVEQAPDPSVFPIAMPLIAGPGAMTTMILLTGQQSGNITGQVVVFGVMVSVLLLVFIMFMAGNLIEKLLGKTGINLITRLFGMFLAALSVQFVIDGIRDIGLGG
ncbi:MAG: MarC family protein [Rhodobacteraceae bacterium]|nr:MarC family protein [Paracoccaceae bacterium]